MNRFSPIVSLLLMLGLVAISLAGQVPITGPSAPPAGGAAPLPAPVQGVGEHDHAGEQGGDHAGHSHGGSQMPALTPEEKGFLDRLEKTRAVPPKNVAEEEAIRREYTAILKEFCAKLPGSPRAMAALSSMVGALLTDGKVAEAEALGQDVLKTMKTPADTVRTSLFVVEIYASSQQPAKAIDLLRNLLREQNMKELEPRLKYRLATLLAEAQRYDAALATLKGFVDANPIHPVVGKFELKMADVLLSAGKPKEAMAHLETFSKTAISQDDKVLIGYFMGMARLSESRLLTGTQAQEARKAALASLEPLMAAARKDPASVQQYGAMAFSLVAEIHLAGRDTTAAGRVYDEMAKLFKGRPEGSYAEKMGKDLVWTGKKAPDFSGPGLDGTVVKANDLAGKIVLLDFWATWCAPCRNELPWVRRLAEITRGKPFAIVSVSLDKADAAGSLKKFVVENQMSWKHIFDGKGWDSPLCKQFDVTGVPSMFVIDENGRILRVGLRGQQLREVILGELRRLELPGKDSVRPPPSPSSVH